MFAYFTLVLEVEELKKLKTLLFLLIFTGCSKALILNNKGVLDFYFEDHELAKSSFLKSLVLNPESSLVRYNMSLVDISEERLALASKELSFLEEKTLNSKDYRGKPQDLFKVLFAQAFIKGLLKNVPEALEKYQDCLEVKPNSREVKKNIELLLSAQSGDSGPQGQEQKSDKESKKGNEESEAKNQGDKQDESDGKDKSDSPIKGRDDSTLKRKKLSENEIEQILNEIKNQESKIRSQENTKYKGEGANGKTW